MIDNGEIWFVSRGHEPVYTGYTRPLTRWGRFMLRMKRPYWAARYFVEDLAGLIADRVHGAWRVLLGRSTWL